MSQLTSSDNCEPRALSKGTTVIVLIGPPLLCWERKMLSNVIAPQHLKIKHAHIEHQKKDMSAFYLLRTIIWHFGALSGLSPTLERAALSVIAGSGLGGRPKALDNWAHGAWHSSWLVTTDANQSVSGLPATVWLEDFCPVGVMCSCSGCLSTFPPAGLGHQANHWHKTLDAGETRKKMAEANNKTHEK